MLDCEEAILQNGTDFYFIDDKGLDYKIEQPEAVIKVAEGRHTVKVEGLESFYDYGKTVHGFISPAGSVSFKTHVDPVDLDIKCLHGRKWMDVSGVIRYATEGVVIFVRNNVPHRAINTCRSVSLSIEI